MSCRHRLRQSTSFNLTRRLVVGSTPITNMYCRFRREVSYVKIVFGIRVHVLCPCNCILLQCCCLFCYQKKLTRSQRSLFPFFIVTSLFCVFYFTCQTHMTKGLKQFMNMYTTSLTAKTYFETFLDLSPQTALMRYPVSRNTLHCLGTPLLTGSF